MLTGLLQQFARPRGLSGRVAGYLMSRLSAGVNRWVVELLDVQPEDRVLDIGCGPGVAISLVACRAAFTAGVDPSLVMIEQATSRNRSAIRQGRVALRLGTVSHLPYPDRHFTKVCAVHSIYFWPSIPEDLREVRRVLEPGGLLVAAVRTCRTGAGRHDPSHYGMTEEGVAEAIAAMRVVGFTGAATEVRELGRETVTAILARASSASAMGG